MRLFRRGFSLPKRRLLAAALGLAVIVAVCLSGWLSLQPTPRYSVTDLGTLPGDGFSSASGLNSRGDVVGLSETERRNLQRAFLYRNGAMTDLGQYSVIGGPAINGGGQVTGTMRVPVVGARWRVHAFLYDAGGMHDLGTPPGDSESLGRAINARGQIAGEAWGNRSAAYQPRAFLYDGGRLTDIGGLPRCTGVSPTGINAAGQIVGECYRQGGGVQAFVYDSRTRKMTALATPPGVSSGASGINDRGQIAGSVAGADGPGHAALWAGGRMTDLGILPGADAIGGAALNNSGVVVGTARTQPNTLGRLVNDHPIRLGLLAPLFQQNWTERAFVYRDGRMQDLNALIPARLGWTLEEASGINDRGQIVGRGLHQGQERAFLLTPVR